MGRCLTWARCGSSVGSGITQDTLAMNAAKAVIDTAGMDNSSFRDASSALSDSMERQHKVTCMFEIGCSLILDL